MVAPVDKPSDPRAPGGGSQTKQAFDDIYRGATWGTNDAGAGNSGTGSTMKSTAAYRVVLQQFLADHGIRSVVDAGCGDWEFSQLIDWGGIDYKGFDIVDAVIEQNKHRFTAPNVHFFVGNIVEDELPAADLLISKHVLQHLPERDVKKFLLQLPKFKHALLTNGVDTSTLSSNNATDIKPGEYRTLDITKPPFGIPGAKLLTYWDGLHMHQVVHVNRDVLNK